MTAIGVDTVEVVTWIPPEVVAPTSLRRPRGWGAVKIGQRRSPRHGKMLDWQGLAGPRGTFLTWVPEAREVRLRLSIPRLAYPLGVPSANAPLRPYRRDVLRVVCQHVLHAMGAQVSSVGVDHIVLLGVEYWAVRKCSFTADVEVTDIIEAFRALGTLERKYSRGARFWTERSQITGFQWETEDHRFQVYGKGKQLLSEARKERGDDRRALLLALGRNHENTLRLEVTCRTAKGVRDLLGISGAGLPTLRRVLQPDVAGYALGREIERLGLSSVSALSRARGGKQRALALDFLAARDRLLENGEQLGRHANLKASRLLQLLGYYCAAGSFSRAELKALWGLSNSTRRELEHDLKGLGLPPVLRQAPTTRRVLAEIVEALRPLVTTERPTLGPGDLDAPVWSSAFASLDLTPNNNFGDLVAHG